MSDLLYKINLLLMVKKVLSGNEYITL